MALRLNTMGENDSKLGITANYSKKIRIYQNAFYLIYFQRRQSLPRVLQLVGVELEFNPGLGDSAAHGFNFAGLLPFLCIFIRYF